METNADMTSAIPENLILFDGVCNLCDGFVQFVIRNDKEGKFRFGTLQSPEAEAIFKTLGYDYSVPKTVILIQNGKMYQRSEAALRVAKGLRFPLPLSFGFIVVPAFIRDWVYDFVARNRYRWFGKKDVCMIPTPELRARFL